MTVSKIIQNNFMESYLQPIVSTDNKKIFGFEALLRPARNSPYSFFPHELFSMARKEHNFDILDNRARHMALLKFKKYFDENNSLNLFLNFEIEALVSNDIYSFIEKTKELDIPLSNILIEVKEDICTASGKLYERIEELKKLGALICIDDFGSGYSNFDRINLIRPHLIKLDRSIVDGICVNRVNFEIVRMITKMANKLGVCVLAEGLEEHHDIIRCMGLGIGLFQGFYFSKPISKITKNTTFLIHDKIDTIDKSFTHISQTYKENRKKIIAQANSIAKQSIVLLSTNNRKEELQKKLQKLVENNEKIELIFFINYKNGLQIGSGFRSSSSENKFARVNGNRYNHNNKEYYLSLYETPQVKYLSEPFVSKLSGEICRTFSLKMKRKGRFYIVCLNIIDSDFSFF